MSWFDFFTAKSTAVQAGVNKRARSTGSAVRRYAPEISKKAQPHDRQAAIDALAKIGSAEAAAVLLKRYTFSIDPSITDQDERDTAFRGIIAAGHDALPAIRDFCANAESVTWPLRMMRELLDDPELVDEIIELLEAWDTEYHRNPDPKVQLIGALERVKDARVRPAVERFLEDFHEPARFHAVITLLAQDAPEAAGPLARALVREEAVRTQDRIAEGLAMRGWVVPAADRALLAERLPRGYRLDRDGRVVR
ncbi:MAG: HEAT repeat domain-containing protein [Deltaproteobacteria bacterium]|nr:HEAT repeat domain-containing protein [Deltaproteobacteria bacterium]